MIVNTELTVRDNDGDQLSFCWDDDNEEVWIRDEDRELKLILTKDDAKALVRFLARFGVSA